MSEFSPLVSIVIPNYNYAQYLGEAIESAVAQTYDNIEVIVVDDGSTDGSRTVVASFGRRITAVLQPNRGQLAAVENGIRHARGEIISLLDSDDRFLPRKIECVVDFVRRNPEVAQISDRAWPTQNFSTGDVVPLLLRFGRYRWGQTSQLSYPRRTLERLLPFPHPPEQLRWADTYLTVAAAFLGPVGAIGGEPLTYRRMHSDSDYHSSDIDKRMGFRELTAEYIARAAERRGILQRFELAADPDWVAYRLAKTGAATLGASLRLVRQSWTFDAALGIPARHAVRSAIRRAATAQSPEMAHAVRNGIRSAVKRRLRALVGRG